MNYKYLTNSGLRKYFNAIVCIIMFTILNTASGCYSSYAGQVKPESMTDDVPCKVIKVIMKDGTVVDLRYNEAMFLKKYHGQSKVVVYMTKDTSSIKDGSKKFTAKTNILKLEDIKSLLVEKDESNTGLNILMAILIIKPLAIFIVLGTIGSNM